MIVVDHLTKHYGATRAVEDLSFRALPGRVTGFLGPNGAGKSTTMRLILGLDRPTSGSATIGGVPYRELATPLAAVGALLDANALDPRRRAVDHLRWLATSNGIDHRRIDTVLGLVGLEHVAGRRAGTFSLGMKQRLGLAAALLGDPESILLDEPINGLDPEGILWLRAFLRGLADDGRTVFLSSHLMAEMAQIADQLVVVEAGRLVADAPTSALVADHAADDVLVRVADRHDELAALLVAAGGSVAPTDDGALAVVALDANAIGRIAAQHAIALAELTPRRGSLEAAFLALTHAHAGDHAGAAR